MVKLLFFSLASVRQWEACWFPLTLSPPFISHSLSLFPTLPFSFGPGTSWHGVSHCQKLHTLCISRKHEDSIQTLHTHSHLYSTVYTSILNFSIELLFTCSNSHLAFDFWIFHLFRTACLTGVRHIASIKMLNLSQFLLPFVALFFYFCNSSVALLTPDGVNYEGNHTFLCD